MSEDFFLHLESLIQHMGQEASKSGDFVLICEGKRIKCHKVGISWHDKLLETYYLPM